MKKHPADWLLTGLWIAAMFAGCGSDGGEDGLTPPEGMVLVAAGDFTMGLDGGQPDQAPAQTVHLDDYFIDKYEVTAAQYKACVDAGHCSPAFTGVGLFTYAVSGKQNHPINGVDWTQATGYCQAQGKRLPTEAEWEKAARGTDKRLYPWGNTAPDCTYANYLGCVDSTSAVGSYPKGISPYGAYDMTGNVGEWVNDWYSETYYSVSPSSNPGGPASGSARVFRPGSWTHIQPVLDSVFRDADFPSAYTDDRGFRCALTP